MPLRDVPETLGCRALYKSFGGVAALDDVDVTFQHPAVTAIIGPNGAGKTTLVNVISGFVRPDSGRCCLGKLELTGRPPDAIARAGVCRTFQDLRLAYGLTALENVLLAQPDGPTSRLSDAWPGRIRSRRRSEATERAIEALGFVGLGDAAAELAANLSFGQQKLLTIACCVATDPRVLMLDEPVSGVDRSMIPRILRLIRALGDQGRLVVFVEHDLTAVREAADSVVVMSVGKIVGRGAPSEILERPATLETYLT